MPAHILQRMDGELIALETLEKRRYLPGERKGIDFYSNDYLGLAQTQLPTKEFTRSGAGGSRLISGDHTEYQKTEQQLAKVHGVDTALIFPSGFMANVGLFSCIAKKGDVVLYDELCHASIRDGLRLSNAQSFKFTHNSLQSLEQKLQGISGTAVFVVTESVFSMDGDEAPVLQILALCKRFNAHLIVDEAHALGYFGLGKVYQLGVQTEVLATVVTFSKALGLHGGAVLGSQTLCDYLINFSRPFIYTTGLPPANVEEIGATYQYLLKNGKALRKQLSVNLEYFKTLSSELLKERILPSNTPIQAVLIPGNDNCRRVEQQLVGKGLLVKAILHPTVPEGRERIRVILHAFNTKQEIRQLIKHLELCLK